MDENLDIEITVPGVYDFEGTLYIPSHRRIRFSDGAVIRRQAEKSGKNGYFMINSGALSGEENEDIGITGLTLYVNNTESAAALAVPELRGLLAEGEDALNKYFDRTVPGLRGQLSFMYIKDLVIKDLTVPDLCSWDYCVHISDFDGVELDGIFIEGSKDAVHFGAGKNFTLRNGVFRTKDDPIALNADDYSPSAPTFGSIENGLIENCRDLEQSDTCGYFVRFITGASREWKSGMTVTHSEAVRCGGRFYRAFMPDDGTELVSVTAPSHEKGFAVADGIAWYRTHVNLKAEELPRTADIKNITLRGLSSEKTRSVTAALYIPDNENRHGWHPGDDIPVISDVTFDGLSITGRTKTAFLFKAPAENFKIKNSDLGGAAVRFEQASCGEGHYPASFSFENVKNFRVEDSFAFTERPADAEKDKTVY